MQSVCSERERFRVQVQVWKIPDSGLKENLIMARKELLGHSRRVGLIEWHPTARDVLLSSAYDYQVHRYSTDAAAGQQIHKQKHPLTIWGKYLTATFPTNFAAAI